MALGKRQRKILAGLGIGLAALIVAGALLPVWFPWVLRPIAGRQGIHYIGYERGGFERFTLRGVTFTNQTVSVRAEQIEGWTPGIWLWRLWAGSPNGAQPFVRGSGWQVEVAASQVGGARSSAYGIFQDVGEAAGVLKKWLPTATFSNGVVHAQNLVVEIPDATWSGRKLRAKTYWPRQAQALVVSAEFGKARAAELELDSDTLHIRSKVRLSADDTALKLQSSGFWRSNAVEVEAGFHRSGMLPMKGSLRAPNFQFPAEPAGLEGYRPLTGSLTGEWKDGRFVLDAHAEAVAEASETNLPPAAIQLRARGDIESAVIESAVISLPWLQAELSRDLNLYYSGVPLREPATFKVTADLSGQPWAKVQGAVKGEVELTPAEGKIPDARFHFSGLNAGNSEIKARTFEARGNLRWPWLEVGSIEADFQEGATVQAGGKLNLDKRVISDGRFTLSGKLLQRWLPPGYVYESLSVTGKCEGPLDHLIHSGHLEVAGLASPELRPLQVRADWAGEQTVFREVQVLLVATNSALSARGSLEFNATSIKAAFDRLALTNHGVAVLELESPTKVSLNGEFGGTNGWLAQVESFQWRGNGGKIQAQAAVQWPRSGDLQCSMEGLHSELFEDFFKAPLPKAEIHNLNVSAGWTNGPMTFGIEFSGTAMPPRELAALESAQSSDTNLPGILSNLIEMELKLSGDQRGVILTNLVVSTLTSSVAVARGFLPFTLNPGRPTNFFRLDHEGPLDFTASTSPHPFFWGKVAKLTGLILRDPRLEMDVGGTWNEPQGEVRLTAAQIQIPKSRVPSAPSLEKIQLTLKLDSYFARVTNCELLVQGQRVTLAGEVPLGESFWRGFREKQIPNWEHAAGRVRVEDADIAAFAAMLPDAVSPAGRLNLDISVVAGGKLEGGLTVQGARTRPLPGTGPIRDIAFDLRILDRTVKLESATGRIGGAAINVTGQADLRGTNWLKGRVPPFEVVLKGTNVPLSRQPDSVVRGDLDLTIRKTGDAPAVISGETRLRNSFYLSDLADLIPGQVASPEQRPPYFSIEQDPLADWRVDVRVTGSRWLRVRSPLFNGDVSANLRIIGSLREPVALGDVRIDSGTVRFPFASLKVRQGLVTLSSQNPYHPQLQVSATSKEYGYDITMQVSGSADAPIVQFTSSPPLSSEQIVLLVTAGTIPAQERLSTTDRAGTVALFLGRDLLSKLGFRDEDESRLDIHSGQDISEQGRPTYNVEYKLSERWSLVGEYDRFGAYNAGFKWRIYSK